MNIYLPNGYLDTKGIRASGYPFVFCTSARGIGKTYGELWDAAENGHNILLVRYGQSQLEALCTREMNPYNQINIDNNVSFGLQMTGKYTASIGTLTDDDGKSQISAPFGVGVALSTFHNIRSFGAVVDRIFYDEFIPAPTARKIRDESDALYNLIESVNRSRELNGKLPAQLFAASNANTIQNPIYRDFGLLPLYDKMQKNGAEYWADEKRGVLLVRPNRSKIVDQKRNTALGRLSAGTRFASMAYDNAFVADDIEPCKSLPLKDYSFLTTVQSGDTVIAIYRHKTLRTYYVRCADGKTPAYQDNPADRKRFALRFAFLTFAMLDRRITYEDSQSQVALKEIVK